MTIKTVTLALVLLSLAAIVSVAEEMEMDQADITVKTKSTDRAKYKDEVPDALDATRCKQIAKTGTRIKTKICATNRQWEESAQRARELTEYIQRRAQY